MWKAVVDKDMNDIHYIRVYNDIHASHQHATFTYDDCAIYAT